MFLYWFTVFLCHFTTIISLSCINYLIISLPSTYFLLLYRICDNRFDVMNRRLKYLLIICIVGIFTSAI
nr:MAG TPA: hypothetical protein [Caudoviricetes sp.]